MVYLLASDLVGGENRNPQLVERAIAALEAVGATRFVPSSKGGTHNEVGADVCVVLFEEDGGHYRDSTMRGAALVLRGRHRGDSGVVVCASLSGQTERLPSVERFLVPGDARTLLCFDASPEWLADLLSAFERGDWHGYSNDSGLRGRARSTHNYPNNLVQYPSP